MIQIVIIKKKYIYEAVCVFEHDGNWKKMWDVILKTYHIKQNSYWSVLTGGDIRTFIKIFPEKLRIWKDHVKNDKHLQYWDKVTLMYIYATETI